MNNTQKNFRKEMKRLKKEKAQYFEHQEIYQTRSNSIKRKVIIGAGFTGLIVLLIRILLFTNFYAIPVANNISTVLSGSGDNKINSLKTIPSNASKSIQNDVIKEINNILSINAEISIDTSLDEINQYKNDLHLLDIKYANGLKDLIIENMEIYENLVILNNGERSESNVSKFNNYVQKLNVLKNEILNEIESTCKNNNIQVTFENTEDKTFIHYNY